MKVTSDTDGSITTTDCPFAMPLLALPVAFLLFVASVIRIVEGLPWRAWLPPLLGATVAGIGGASFACWTRFRFDVSRREVVWRRRSVFGVRDGRVPFDQIACAVVQYHEGGVPQGPRHFYRVALVTRTGTLPLSTSYSGFESANDKCQRVRSLINAALGVQLPSESDNDILELLRAGQDLWARRLAQHRQGFGRFGAARAAQYVADLQRRSAQIGDYQEAPKHA